MMGTQTAPARLFSDFCLDDHVPSDHLLRRIDLFLDLVTVRSELEPFYGTMGCPSIDPELMMRMLIVGYCKGIRSERRLCEEIHLNLAYRWFCRLGLDGKVPDHSTFSRNRHGRFRQSDILRHLFETVGGANRTWSIHIVLLQKVLGPGGPASPRSRPRYIRPLPSLIYIVTAVTTVTIRTSCKSMMALPSSAPPTATVMISSGSPA
jgi:transposase